MSSQSLYSRDEVERMLYAYRAIFPTISPELASYWGLRRERPWSCVTTDFHAATFDQFHALHKQALAIDAQHLDPQARGAALRNAALATGVGYSIGLSPWTDNLLERTYADHKDRVVILLGHDWYPIVAGERASGTPLMSSDCLHLVERYWPGAPEAVLDGTTVGLFVNLYPDYRPPSDPKCGNLSKYGYSYAKCLLGLDALVAQASRRFGQIQLISWGADVWCTLQSRVTDSQPPALLSAVVQAAPGRVHSIGLGGLVLPYLPIMHPGHWGNFGRAYHLRHVKAGYAALGLGLPGLRDSADGRVCAARTVPLA